MTDFTIQIYKTLLITLQKQGFEFLLYKDFLNDYEGQKQLILRHDVDARKENSLHFARIEHKMGIVGTYYFRIMPQSFDEKIIKEIAGLGHEIGYHYETMATISKKIKVKDFNVLIDAAYEEFRRNLETFRKICSIETICMHGSPFSKFDNRAIWGKYDYKKLGIFAEPYFDVDFNEVMYLTDTGRRWDGDSVSIRDKAVGDRRQAAKDQTKGRMRGWTTGGEENPTPRTQLPELFPRFHSTFDIINAAEKGQLPDKIMMTFHPQRWTDKLVPWMKELIWQNVKNMGKSFLIKVGSE
jgi:hypothetical protein